MKYFKKLKSATVWFQAKSPELWENDINVFNGGLIWTGADIRQGGTVQNDQRYTESRVYTYTYGDLQRLLPQYHSKYLRSDKTLTA